MEYVHPRSGIHFVGTGRDLAMAQKDGKIMTQISASEEKCMKGAELCRVREASGLTQEQLAVKMSGWGWYREKVIRLEESKVFCLNAREMQTLLDALGARTI